MTGEGKVLLIRLSSLGDVVLSTAAVEALAEEVRGVEIHVLTKPAFRDVFRRSPKIASVLDWDPAEEGLLALARRIRGAHYDWVVDLHGNLRTRLLRILVRNSRWTGYRKGILARRVAVALRRESVLPSTHVVDRYIGALRPLGVSATRRLPRVEPGDQERAAVERLLREGGWDGSGRWIAFAPGARWPTKTWPRERWTSLLRSAGGENLGFAVLLGGKEEADRCAAILRDSGAGGVNLAGATSILGSTAVLQGAAALVTNDSASLHLATAVRTPVLALFGPTVRGFGFYPLGPRDVLLERKLSCRPCSLHGGERCPLRHHRCLEDIEPDEVLAELRRIALEPTRGTPDNPATLGEV